jgi:hypothetical protein
MLGERCAEAHEPHGNGVAHVLMPPAVVAVVDAFSRSRSLARGMAVRTWHAGTGASVFNAWRARFGAGLLLLLLLLLLFVHLHAAFHKRHFVVRPDLLIRQRPGGGISIPSTPAVVLYGILRCCLFKLAGSDTMSMHSRATGVLTKNLRRPGASPISAALLICRCIDVQNKKLPGSLWIIWCRGQQ